MRRRHLPISIGLLIAGKVADRIGNRPLIVTGRRIAQLVASR